MKTIIINIEKERVTVDGKTCNFIEAGLMPNGKKVTDEYEIVEYLEEQYAYKGEEVEVIFE